MRNMNPVRIALIGAGGIVAQAHKPAFLRFPEEIQPVAVADPHLPSAEALATEFGVPFFPTMTRCWPRWLRMRC